jgi:hypothetical protein
VAGSEGRGSKDNGGFSTSGPIGEPLLEQGAEEKLLGERDYPKERQYLAERCPKRDGVGAKMKNP